MICVLQDVGLIMTKLRHHHKKQETMPLPPYPLSQLDKLHFLVGSCILYPSLRSVAIAGLPAFLLFLPVIDLLWCTLHMASCCLSFGYACELHCVLRAQFNAFHKVVGIIFNGSVQETCFNDVSELLFL